MVNHTIMNHVVRAVLASTSTGCPVSAFITRQYKKVNQL